MLTDPNALPPKERALAAFARTLADTPWTISVADIDGLRAVGMPDLSILHATVLASYFNYLNRVADAVDIEFDYESPLPRMKKQTWRAPAPLPEVGAWPSGPAPLQMSLSQRPNTHEPYVRWKRYVLEREAPLAVRDRRVIARAAAAALADLKGCGDFADAEPKGDREAVLASFATALTSTPWKIDQRSIDALRGLGLDDLGVLDVVSVASFQNTASRLNHVILLP